MGKCGLWHPIWHHLFYVLYTELFTLQEILPKGNILWYDPNIKSLGNSKLKL